MPSLIDVPSSRTCDLEECIEGLAELDFDSACSERTKSAALWLRKLNNNGAFLGDMLVDQLTAQHRDIGQESGFSPQAIVLSPKIGNVFLRANIWPAEDDLCFRTSGARTFVYGVPHDHNFSFLTSGYLGPGYRSDYYDYDYDGVVGYAGEPVDLRFIERTALTQGKLMLYRAHKDIHSQLPPESLSVSLNVMHVDPAQHWFDQYGFDLHRGTVRHVLSPNSTEIFLRVAIATGMQEAFDFAEWAGQHHPSDRLRQASFEARGRQLSDEAERDALWYKAETSGNRLLEAVARQKRTALAMSG